jgi:hypothetical protein
MDDILHISFSFLSARTQSFLSENRQLGELLQAMEAIIARIMEMIQENKPIFATPSSVDTPERAKLTANLQKLCKLVNMKLTETDLFFPHLVGSGLVFDEISRSLRAQNQTIAMVNSNFEFISTYLLRNINHCTAIHSSSKTDGNFDIELMRTLGNIGIHTYISTPQDPEFCIMLSKL